MKFPMGVPSWGSGEILAALSTRWRFVSVPTIERQIAETFGVKFCVLTDLGRQAIYLGLKCLGLKEGDGVIVPSYVCQSAILPIIAIGAVPQFADIDDDLHLSPSSVSRVLDARTRVILVPHLYGKVGRIDDLLEIAERNKLHLIDDAAQAVGAKHSGKWVGTLGDLGILSFGPFKSIMATRGGAIVTNDDRIYSKIREQLPLPHNSGNAYIRFAKNIIKFKYRKYTYSLVNKIQSLGKNEPVQAYRATDLSEVKPLQISVLDAFITLKQIEKIERIVRRRLSLANYLTELLAQCEQLELPEVRGQENVFTKYVLRIRVPTGALQKKYALDAKRLITYLRRSGIEAHGGYSPLHLDRRFSDFPGDEMDMTMSAHRRVACLPLTPNMTYGDVEDLASRIKNIVTENA